MAILFLLTFAPLSLYGDPPIELDELPSPPREIRKLIQSANVTMESGEANDRDPKLAGLTDYKIQFQYGVRPKWHLDSTGTRLRISTRYFKVDWSQSHKIWLRKKPPTDQFWSSELVLHEFDHVRISSDPRFKAMFETRLRKSTSLTREVSENDKVNRALIDTLIDEHVNGVFKDVTDLISIRYKELDRVTNHGRRPIPEDSEMAEYFRELDEATEED
ncbi:MAG: hypothetical protein AB8B91_21685 [Rubripirellula sp.]